MPFVSFVVQPFPMQYFQNILQTIGNTPMVRLNKVVDDIPALVLGKIETFNPGHSIKDRMALKMLEVAEAEGKIKPGGTIIECTSGNTGMGLALAACVKGYRCIFTTSDKQSKEKFDILRAHGAEVIVCPTNVEATDPRSYYSVAERLSKEIPNSFWFNQYDNLANRLAHYESTGPEIWEQTDGKITHLVVGAGTGGTVTGTATFLKEKNPDIKIWAIDTFGSTLKEYHETGKIDERAIYPYITEGIGEDIIPENYNFDVIDHFEKVTDKDGAVWARRMARDEGLLLGYSAGSALAGLLQLKDSLTKDDVVVIIFHDHGTRYVGKIYNDEWMRERGFLEADMTVRDLIAKKDSKHFYFVKPESTVKQAFEMMKENDISQMPVMEGSEIVGAIDETKVLKFLLENPMSNVDKLVESIMDKPFPMVEDNLPFRQLGKFLNKKTQAVVAKDRAGSLHMITQYDVIRAV